MKKILFPVLAVSLAAATVLTVNSCKKDEDNVPNTTPKASFTVTPSSGTTDTQFEFDASGCSDKEDATSTLKVRWDWDNDGSWDADWSPNKIINHQYSTEGTYTVKMEVKDTEGLTDNTTHIVTIDNGGGVITGTFADQRDGQTYKYVQIDSQTWMAENLNYEIGNSWCYDNNSSNCANYGRLYDWSTALDICPPGWHLPSDDEWCTLTTYVDPTVDCNVTEEWKGTDVGYKIKSTSGWYSNGNGSDAYDFAALPAGWLIHTGGFIFIEEGTNFWSSTESGARWYLKAYSDKVYSGISNPGNKFSVRCVKD